MQVCWYEIIVERYRLGYVRIFSGDRDEKKCYICGLCGWFDSYFQAKKKIVNLPLIYGKKKSNVPASYHKCRSINTIIY